MPPILALVSILFLLASIILLWHGADAFVEGAVNIAQRFAIPDLVIGLTLVGLGTSAPEFAVSIGSALAGQTNISVANVVGSNVFNLGIILGTCAAIRPLPADRQLVYRDGVVLTFVALLLSLLISDRVIDRFDGIILVASLLAYMGLILWLTPRNEEDSVSSQENISMTKSGLSILIGLVAILLGAKLLVWSATQIARAMGMSEWAIGVTIVAAGTSAPELVTSLNAVLKGRFGMGAGNLIGSDLFNTLGVLGVASLIVPLDVMASAIQSVLAMALFIALAVFFMRTGFRISRVEGIVLLVLSLLRWAWEIGFLSPESLG